MDCIPPWLSSKHQCFSNISTYNHSKKEISEIIHLQFIEAKISKKLTQVEMNCKKPCRKMTNRVSLADKAFLGCNVASVEFRFEKTVKVEKKIIVYTWFNFIVDVGSSLGLWLGLSALGITDLVIEAFMVAKKWLSVK